MKTYTLEFDTTELVKLISICNTAIVFNEATLEHLSPAVKGSENCKADIAVAKALIEKIKKAIRDGFDNNRK